MPHLWVASTPLEGAGDDAAALPALLWRRGADDLPRTCRWPTRGVVALYLRTLATWARRSATG